MKNIFNYSDYRRFLQDYYLEQKKNSRFFSYRYFCKKVGSSSSSWLLFVIQAKRNLSEKAVEKFIPALKLEGRFADYFRVLVRYNQATTAPLKDKLYKELLGLSGGPSIKMVEKGQYEFYSKWYHHAIREMISLKGFKEDPNWIAKELCPCILPSDARKSLALLKNLGMVKYDAKNRLVPSDNLISTGNEVSAHSIREFHRQMILLAKESIDHFPPAKREISSVTASFSKACFIKLKKRITEVEDELMHIIEDDKEESTQVYQLNFQLFPLLQRNDDEKA